MVFDNLKQKQMVENACSTAGYTFNALEDALALKKAIKEAKIIPPEKEE